VAEYIWDPSEGLAYPDFRKPWYGWLIGGLGQVFGYFQAAQFIGRLSMVLMVFAAALLGSALSGRVAGFASCIAVPLMPLVMDGALWVNHYPLLGATVGLAVASGAVSVRSPSWRWAAVAGLFAGASFAIDVRGSVAVPMVGALVFVGGLRHGWRQLAKRIALTIFFVGAVLGHDIWLQSAFQVPQLEFARQLEVQRKGTLEQIERGVFDVPGLQSACQGQVVRQLAWADLDSKCGEVLAESSRRRLSALRIVPFDKLFWGLPLLLIPMYRRDRWRWESTLASCVVFGAPLVSLWIGMRWVTYFDRYMLPFAAIMACAAPVAFGRLVQLTSPILPRARNIVSIAAGAGAIWFSIGVWPGWGARALDAPELARSSEYHAGIFAKWVRESIRVNDVVIDCAGLAVDSLTLPDKIDYVGFPPGDSQCETLIESPKTHTGTVYLITMHRDLPPQYSRTQLAFNPKAISALGWEPVQHGMKVEGFRLWKYR